jgi:hypothetical protein
MTRWETCWEFHTRNLNVTFQVTPCEENPADHFEFPDDIEAVQSGRVEWFDCRVRICWRDGTEIGSDYLGCCAYTSVREFYESHRDPDPLNRNSSIMRAKNGENTAICHYFPSMVAEAIAEARKRFCAMRTMPLRCA